MKWAQEEEVLLVDLYYDLSSLSSEEREVKIENLSSLLRNRAISLGINIDETFRNITGIKMKLQNIAYIDTGGKRGLSSFSKIDKETVLMYKERRNEFNKILIEARNKYMDNKSTFLEWLTDVEKSKISNDILNTLSKIDEYALKTKKSVNSLWSIAEVKEWNKFVSKINADKFFRIKNKLKDNHYTFALNCYLNFIMWDNLQNTKLLDEKNIESDVTSQKIVPNEECIRLEDKIKALLKKTPEIAFSVSQISNYFKDISNREEVKDILRNASWAEETKSSYFKYKEAYEENNPDNEERGETVLKTVDFISLDDFKPILHKSESIDYHEYEKVLLENFPRGFKKGSSIDTKKFRRFYEEIFEKDLLDDDESIQRVVAEIGIEYEDSRIMSPQNAINEELLSSIFDYIDDSFDSGKTMIYYKSIYEQFEQELITTNVYNDKILKQVLIYFAKGKYHFKRSFITSNPNIEADPAVEIKEVLESNILPMSYEEIEAEISHIPLSKLKFIMAHKPEFINTKRNYYTHINCIYLDNTDIELINNIIDEAISENGFITREDIVKKLELNNSHIIEKNPTLTVLGLGNALAQHCSARYDCNGGIFSPKGENLSIGKVFSNYCLNKNIVKIVELEILAKELGFTSLPGIYLGEVFEEFVRINKETLVRKDRLNFNSKKIDLILDKFCISDYIALSEVNTFALFPSSEYAWNNFLLDSYVKNYSVSYRYLGDSISMSKCVGAIVKKESKFADYDQILTEVLSLSQGNCLADKKEALNYLYENGFIAKRRMNNIDALIANAKIIKEQRGKV